jgi:hypothetical protein
MLFIVHTKSYIYIVQSVVWQYNEFGDKLRDIENRKLCDHMKR